MEAVYPRTLIGFSVPKLPRPQGGPEERAALAEKLRITADAYASGQPPGSPGQTLAADLRALAERLAA